MKILSKKEKQLCKDIIIRKQDFPDYLDRDVFLWQLCDNGCFRFNGKYNENSESFSESWYLAATLTNASKRKINNLISSIHNLLIIAEKREYYDLCHNLKILIYNIDKVIDMYNDIESDEKVKELLEGLNIKLWN